VFRLVASLAVVAATLAAPAHAATGDISTVAGTGTPAMAGDGGPAGAAALNHPQDVAWLPDGSVLVADTNNHRVRRIWPSGIIGTVAGTGTPGFSGDGGAATSAQLSSPTDVEPTADGGFLVADLGNHRVRKVSAGGTIATVAGTGTAGSSGDGGPATSARLESPAGVAATGDGGFLIADSGADRVRAVSSGGTISTVAGGGGSWTGDGGPATAARLDHPVGVAALPGGGFLVSEYGGHRVRVVSPTGTIARAAGTGDAGFSGDGGAATAARLNQPVGISPTSDGGFLIADSGNARVRKVSPQGSIVTVAGSGTPGFAGDGGPAVLAHIHLPTGAAEQAGGAILVADAGNDRVRLIEGAAPPSGAAPPAADPPPRSAPLLKAPRVVRASANGIVRLGVGCPAEATERCRGTIRLEVRRSRARGALAARAARTLVIARARFSVAAGDTRRVKLRLSKAGRRLLRKRRTITVKAVATRRGGPNIGERSDSVTFKLKSKQRGRRSGRHG
jgi:NHL repeat